MYQIKLPRKISLPRERLVGIFVNHIGEFFILLLFIIFAAGGYIFWKYAWIVSNFQPKPQILSSAIPQKSLDEILQHIEQREKDFKSLLPALSIRDPFQETVPH